MPESETGTPTAASVPATPETPGGPLFSSVRIDSLERESFAMGRCNMCMPGGKSNGCIGVRIPSVSLTQKIGAEFVGTFILIYAATAGPIVNNKYNGAETLMGNAACAGLTVMFIILSIGHISAQVSASICACYALKVVYHPFLSGGVTVPTVSIGQAFATEFIITFILLFVVTAVATDTRAVGELAGIAVGATVLLNILISGPTSGGSMNPVRTLGPAVAAGNYKHIWIYLVAPTLGALAGSGVYTLVKLRDYEAEPVQPVRSFRR
ncbi:unnamed protein product [Vicia faba]|uniref:Uncharacterized protein n=1 Tax=Vicia faba TaxID=3906 RepID=A0AAV1A2Q0_VICFA|nr:unnamed protein product [Vicia faba]